jgi:hypothetical protein
MLEFPVELLELVKADEVLWAVQGGLYRVAVPVRLSPLTLHGPILDMCGVNMRLAWTSQFSKCQVMLNISSEYIILLATVH